MKSCTLRIDEKGRIFLPAWSMKRRVVKKVIKRQFSKLVVYGVLR
jgi:DNA-binding transcriptional regulator/RsmH inhibitor MraZ